MAFLTTSKITTFLPGFSSSQGWLLVTRTRGVWWCRYRGHWRSGPRHLSPRSIVCAQEWHRKDIHSHIHSHPPMHTPNLTKSETLNSPNMTPSISCPRHVFNRYSNISRQRQLQQLPRLTPGDSDTWPESDDVIIADIGGQALDIFLHGPESAHKNGIVKTFTHTSIPIHPCSLLI